MTSKVLAKERKKLGDNGIDVRKEPIAFDVTLSFTMGCEKGVLEVSATSGKTKLGDAQMNYEASTNWKQTSSENVEAEA